MIAAGKASARRLTHARVLLKADAAGGPARPDARIAEATEVSVATVERVRQRFEAALARTKHLRPGRERGLDGAAEARLIALACSGPPRGRACWTMQTLAGQPVELEVVAAVSDETVRRALRKTRSSRGGRSSGVVRDPSWAFVPKCATGTFASANVPVLHFSRKSLAPLVRNDPQVDSMTGG